MKKFRIKLTDKDKKCSCLRHFITLAAGREVKMLIKIERKWIESCVFYVNRRLINGIFIQSDHERSTMGKNPFKNNQELF